MVCICVARFYAQGYSSAKEFPPSCVSRHLDWEVSAEKKKKKKIFPFVFHPCCAQHSGIKAVGKSSTWFLVQISSLLAVNSQKSHCSCAWLPKGSPACLGKVMLSTPLQCFVF